jgi:hypothetical protein
MARTMKNGDTWPPLRGEAADETGQPVDLSGAVSLTMFAVSDTHTITGPASALWPAVPDADGQHQWNWQYDFVAGDTVVSATYKVRLVVEWAVGETQTFPNTGHETLTIEDDTA